MPMYSGHEMHDAYLWLLGLILIGSLPDPSLWAQSLGPSAPGSLHLAASGQGGPGLGYRSRHLPPMPYPYPRVYVAPYLALDLNASPGTYVPQHPSGPAAQGFLRLEVRPPEAEIYVDGLFIGHGRNFSGPTLVPVWPGGHLVEFRYRGSSNAIRLFVSAGETVQASQDLSPITSDDVRPPAKRWSTSPLR
jgi:hypothetical protein